MLKSHFHPIHFLILILFESGMVWAQLTLPAPVLGENGRYHLQLDRDDSHFAILYHSKDLMSWLPVTVSRLDRPENLLIDSVRAKTSGFLTVRVVPNTSDRDSDGDGLSDFDELRTGAHPSVVLNAAKTIDVRLGTINLLDRETFDRLSHRDNFPGAQNVQEVKFLITDIRTAPKLHFINVNEHEFHADFARLVLDRYPLYSEQEARAIFSSETYFSNFSRQNLAGSIVAHDGFVAEDGTRGIFTLEFWPTDPIPFEWVELAYELISRCAPLFDNLVYHPSSETQRSLLRQEAAKYNDSYIRTIATEQLFGATEYQPMNQEAAFGRLRLADDGSTLSARDIVIFRNLPNDLTKVAGIITELPQTPLSHVNIKAQQNNTPNAFIANASTRPDITALLGQNVYYEVKPEGFVLRAATQQEVDQFFESIRPLAPSFPVRDLSVTDIRPLASVLFSESDAFGGKSANVAELGRLFPDETPDGFAIPFYFYDEFMKHNDLYDIARTMMANETFQSDPEIREIRLKTFRSLIKDSEVPQWMYNALTELQTSFPAEIQPRLRSSANAEDSLTFNGAGLYDSFTHKSFEGHISKSVLQVWASLWNYRAYEEREFFRIDHLSSAMGVLVAPGFQNEQANGVAVTRNIFDPNWEGYYINVQTGEDLVTNPDANSIPEEMLVAWLGGLGGYEIQYIRFSNQVEEGERVLTRAQVFDLASKMRQINFRFSYLYGSTDPDFAMEIEFKVAADGKLAIKQARPWVD